MLKNNRNVSIDNPKEISGGMVIALIHYAAPPVVGGVERIIAQHAQLLVDSGYRPRILAGRGEQINPNIPFIQIPELDSRHPLVMQVKRSLDQGDFPEEFNTLQSQITSKLTEHLQDVDILIAHNVCSLHKNLPLTAAIHQISQAQGSPKVILWHHDLAWTSRRYRNELHNGYPWDMIRQDWLNVTHVAVSEMRQAELANLIGVDRQVIRVIPNGLDLDKLLKLETTTIKLMAQLDLLHASPIMLLPVRITRRKNIEMALQIMSALRMQMPDARLIITGPLGPHNPANLAYFKQLLDLRRELDLDEAVHFLAELVDHYLPDAVIADFYHLADGLLMTSREEGFGIPVLEAGLAGIPVFCSDIAPLRALGGDQFHYFSLNTNPKQIAGSIAGHLRSSSEFLMRVHVRSQYTWQRIFQDHVAPLLESLAC